MPISSIYPSDQVFLASLSEAEVRTLLSQAIRFVAGEYRAQPLYVDRRRQRDGSVKWKVTDGDETVALSRQHMDLLVTSRSERDAAHYADTLFSLKEALELAADFTVQELTKASLEVKAIYDRALPHPVIVGLGLKDSTQTLVKHCPTTGTQVIVLYVDPSDLSRALEFEPPRLMVPVAIVPMQRPVVDTTLL